MGKGRPSLKSERLGKIITTIHGDTCRCISYENALDCTIQFIDEYGYILEHIQWEQIKQKKNPSKAPFEKTIRGVACVGRLSNGEIPKPSSDVELAILYSRYANMLSRCYDSSGNVLERKDGTRIVVREDWLNFSTYVEDMRQHPNYKEWFESDGRIEFDKDIKCFLGEDVTKIAIREYSKDTISLVPKKVNLCFKRVTAPFYRYKTTSVILYPTGTDLEQVAKNEVDLLGVTSVLDGALGTKEVRTEKQRKRILDRLVHEKMNEISIRLQQYLVNQQENESMINSLEQELERHENMIATGEYHLDDMDIHYTLQQDLLENH